MQEIRLASSEVLYVLRSGCPSNYPVGLTEGELTMFALGKLPKGQILILLAIWPVLLLGGIATRTGGDWSNKIHFRSPHELAALAERKGLQVHSGRGASSVIDMNCFVADHPIRFEDIVVLNMQECGLTPVWRGIVFVGYLDEGDHQPFGAITPAGINGHHRIWGRVLAAGDPALLDRLESLYQGA
jgi:hypothetical protein